MGGLQAELGADVTENDWSAWYNRMPGGDDPLLHVTGRCSVPSSSATATLELGNEGIVDEPDLIALDLKIKVPEVGDARVTEVDVRWEGNVGPDVRRVRIQGAANGVIAVVDAV